MNGPSYRPNKRPGRVIPTDTRTTAKTQHGQDLGNYVSTAPGELRDRPQRAEMPLGGREVRVRVKAEAARIARLRARRHHAVRLLDPGGYGRGLPRTPAALQGRPIHARGRPGVRSGRTPSPCAVTPGAVDLWRQAILLSSESRRYGDVLTCRRALNAAILEQPVPVTAISELDTTSYARLVPAAQRAELNVLRAAHAGKLPDAFGVTRRCLWESRLSGQLRSPGEICCLLSGTGHYPTRSEQPDALRRAGYRRTTPSPPRARRSGGRCRARRVR